MKTSIQLKNTNVVYSSANEGGGAVFGLNFVPVIKTLYPDRKFKHCLEWCAGPGFIGFDIKDHDLCDEVTFFEKHTAAIEDLNETIKSNHIENAYIQQGSSIKELDGKFDLIVGNPPMFGNEIYFFSWNKSCDERLYVDKDWQAHRDFFNNIAEHLTDDGIILLIEAAWGSSYEVFEPMLSNLKITNHYRFNEDIIANYSAPAEVSERMNGHLYYLEIQKIKQ